MLAAQLNRPEAIIFDMDGTLLQTETLMFQVHKRLFEQLNEEGLYTKPTPPVELLLGSLGMVLQDIWRRLMPDGSEAAHKRADELMLQYELEDLAAGQGQLYPHVLETLQALRRQGIRLFVASNGQEDYVKAIVRSKGMENYFDGLYSAGEYKTASKVDLVARLLKDHRIQAAWMVGDRSSDVEAGVNNVLTVVGCQYAGFGREGELHGADAVITEFRQLLELLPSQK